VIASPGLDIRYQGQPTQRRWHACPAYESGFGGAKFGGKTLGLLMESTRHTPHPLYRGIIFRRTYPQLQEVLDRAWQWFPRMGASWSGDTHAWTFPSGAKLLMRHCQFEHDKENYNGHEYQGMFFDQLEQFTETQYNYLLAQNRSGVAELVPYTRSTFNPGGIGHGWVKQRFIDHGTTSCAPWRDRNDVGKPLPSRRFHFSSIDDNPAGACGPSPTRTTRFKATLERYRVSSLATWPRVSFPRARPFEARSWRLTPTCARSSQATSSRSSSKGSPAGHRSLVAEPTYPSDRTCWDGPRRTHSKAWARSCRAWGPDNQTQR
jgi:hypothetical protein